MALEDVGSWSIVGSGDQHLLRFKKSKKDIVNFVGTREECEDLRKRIQTDMLTAANAAQVSSAAGVKHDDGKPRMDLISPMWIEGVGAVLAFGAKKYEAHNWRKGLTVCRLLGSVLRHIFAYLRGEDNDPESGLPHLHHASCGLMMASEMASTRPDMDDRWKK